MSKNIAKRICVVGAGASGLSSIKACLEEGFDVVCYEKTDNLSGIWCLREELVEGVGSVYNSLITNSSKEFSFSDFPFPEDCPQYLDHKQMHEYFESYAKHFRLNPHILFRHSVLNVSKSHDYDSSHTLVVRIHDIKENKEFSERFDGVMVCIGFTGNPRMPYFEGQEFFKGKIIHSREMVSQLDVRQYEKKTALVIGNGSSGCDCAVILSNIFDKTYLSQRKPVCIISRLASNGQPFDYALNRKYNQMLKNILPNRLIDWYLNSLYRILYNPLDYGAYSEARVSVKMLNNVLPERLLTGKVLLKKTVERFCENGVIFKGDKNETKCDFVVMATGYDVCHHFIDETLLERFDDDNKRYKVYKRILPAHLPFPSLALIGLPSGALVGEPTFIGFASAELQARWYVQVMAGNCAMVSPQHMLAHIEHEHRYATPSASLSPIKAFRNMYAYLDDIADTIGAKPDLKRYAFTDFALFLRLIFGTCLQYQYRLEGRHRWPGARTALMRSDFRVRHAVNASASDGDNPYDNNNTIIQIITIIAFILLLFYSLIFVLIFI